MRGTPKRALAAVRGVGDDYHPFDSKTGAAVEEAQIDKQLGSGWGNSKKLPSRPNRVQGPEALARAKQWQGRWWEP